MSSPWYFASEILWTVTAVVGGTARVLDAYVRTGVFPKMSMLLANGLVSGFSGYMVAQVVMRFDPSWAHVAAGVGGYLGTQGLDWVASVVQARFGGQMPRALDHGPMGGGLAPPPPSPPPAPSVQPPVPPPVHEIPRDRDFRGPPVNPGPRRGDL